MMGEDALGFVLEFPETKMKAVAPLSFVMIVILGVAAIGGTAPASAWDGISRFGMAGTSSGFFIHERQAPVRNGVVGPRIIARHTGMENDLRIHSRASLQNGIPVAIWPYLPFIDTAPTEATSTENGPPDGPQVIVMSDLSHGASQAAAPETPPDYGYAGCHAIPNGYHCDIPRHEATP